MSTPPESQVWSDQFNGVNGAANAGNGANGLPREGASASDLRHGIQRTRSRMSGTIDAIESRLTPQRILTEAKDTLASSASSIAAQAQARANELATTAQARTSELAAMAQEQTQRMRAEYERLRAQYPWLPTALLALGGTLGAGVIALAAWSIARAND